MFEAQRISIVCGGAALFACVCLTTIACVCTVRMVRFWPRSQRAEGVVTAAVLRLKGCAGDDDWWTLTIEYADHTGTRRRASVDVVRNPYQSLKNRSGCPTARTCLVIGARDYDVGDRVPIRYDPDNPAFAVINTFNGTWLGLLALDSLVLGLVAILVWVAGGWLAVWPGPPSG
jgi:hypothetical protein